MILPDWPAYHHFRPQLAKALDPAFYPIEYLDDLLRCGRARLFASGGAAMVAELRLYPGGARAVHCLVAAGRMDEITGVLRPEVEAWGRASGCTIAIVESRAGWAKLLKPHGYAPHQIAILKSL
jgi:hypothetical protein